MKKVTVMKEYSGWYMANIEEPIRKVVFELRNAGINTTGSCGHGMWIQCECEDPTNELSVIYCVMHKLKIKEYRVDIYAALSDFGSSFILVKNGEPPAAYRKVLEIMLPRSDGTYYRRWKDVPLQTKSKKGC